MEIFTLLETIEEMLEDSKKLPFTNKAIVDKEQVLDIIKEIRLKLPEELKQAKVIKEEHDRIIAKANEEAEEIVKEAENRIISMIDEHEITKKAYEQKNKIIETSSSSNKIENKSITVSLFNIIPVKKVDVTTIQDTKIIPLGNTIGIKIYSSGVLVIGMTEIEGKKPYENTGIKEGDLIIKIDNTEVNTTEELIECVNKSQGQNVEVKYLREGTEYITNIEPVKTKDDKYKIGLWVRDGACRYWNCNIL